MKVFQSLFFYSLFFSSCIYSEEPSAPPHRVYLGPTVFYHDYHEKLEAPLKSDETGVFYGIQWGYEYKKLNMIYAGFDFNTSWANLKYDGSMIDLEANEVAPFESDHRDFLLTTEGRIGYNVSPVPKLELIPYTGIGYYRWNRTGDYAEIYNWEYALLGLWVNYGFTPYLDAGINIKLMHMFNGKILIENLFSNSDISDFSLNLGNRFHYTIQFPITFYLNRKKQWDIRVTPFFSQRNIGQSNTKEINFTSVIFEKRKVEFLEPSSRTYQAGVQIEYGYHF